MLLNLCGLVSLRTVDGAAVPMRRHGAALLLYLVLTPGHRASRQDMAALLWPTRAQAQSRGSLRQCLSELRAANEKLGDLIGSDVATIFLKGDIQTDVDLIETASDLEDLYNFLTCLEQNCLLGLNMHGELERWLDNARRSIEIRLQTAVHGKLKHLHSIGLHKEASRIARVWCLRNPDDLVAKKSLADTLLSSAPPVPQPANLESPGVGDAQAPPLLVVAPFDARDGQKERTAAALRDDILLRLGRFRELRLVDEQRASSQILAGPLPGGFLLTASIAAEDGTEMLVCRLISIPGREVIWTDSLDLRPAQLSGSIGQITGQIVDKLTLRDKSNLKRAQIASGQIYARFIAANAASRWPESYVEARAAAALLRLIQSEAPDFAPAYIALARLISTDYGFTRGGPPDAKELEEVKTLAQAGLSLDRGQSNCWTQMGWIHLRRGEWEPARMHFDEALRLNPYHATRVNEIATGFLFLGEQQLADELLERSRSLMVAPDHVYWSDRGLFALVRGDHVTAFDALTCCTEPMMTTDIYSVLAHKQTGRDSAPIRTAAKARLGRIWSHGRTPTFEELSGWFDRHHPFRKQEDRRRFQEMLAAGFG